MLTAQMSRCVFLHSCQKRNRITFPNATEQDAVASTLINPTWIFCKKKRLCCMWCGFDVWLQAEGLLVLNPDSGSLPYTWEPLSNKQDALDLHLHLSKVTYNKYICQKKEKQYIAVSTVTMFIRAMHWFTMLRLPIPKLDRIRLYKMLSTIS